MPVIIRFKRGKRPNRKIMKRKNNKFAPLKRAVRGRLFSFFIVVILIAGAGQAFTQTPLPTLTPELKLDGKFTGAGDGDGLKVSMPVNNFARIFD